ncbi:SDR family NAD(P)-dependent oxidoreductase [uncultured Enterovirga sp.]|uniref:SDR family NAD(P)-dependent oxidoreductase n=1 Tax=uncultured Enterovirga sp. TaxID=2026352 RepID=UPI0035CBECAB
MENDSRRLAIVTGASGGIGKDLGERLAEAGYAVALWDHDGAGAEARSQALNDAGRRSIWARCDVTSTADVERATEEAVSQFGPPCLLVNNAAIRHRMPLEDLPRENWDREIAVNLTGAFQCTQTVGRRMLAAGGGVIVNMASMSGTFGQPMRGAYSPSKAALLGLTSMTAVEWGPRGIRCNAVSPGMIETPVHAQFYGNDAVRSAREAMVPLGRLGTGSDVADVVVWLASEAARYINGANIPVDGGVTRALVGLMPVMTEAGGVTTTLAQLAGAAGQLPEPTETA